MNIKFYYKHINEVIKPDLETYVTAKLNSLQQYMLGAPEESLLANVNIEYFDKHDSYQVNMQIVVRSGKEMIFQAEETKHTYTESIDAVRDKLHVQIVKAKDKLAERSVA